MILSGTSPQTNSLSLRHPPLPSPSSLLPLPSTPPPPPRFFIHPSEELLSVCGPPSLLHVASIQAAGFAMDCPRFLSSSLETPKNRSSRELISCCIPCTSSDCGCLTYAVAVNYADKWMPLAEDAVLRMLCLGCWKSGQPLSLIKMLIIRISHISSEKLARR